MKNCIMTDLIILIIKYKTYKTHVLQISGCCLVQNCAESKIYYVTVKPVTKIITHYAVHLLRTGIDPKKQTV